LLRWRAASVGDGERLVDVTSPASQLVERFLRALHQLLGDLRRPRQLRGGRVIARSTARTAGTPRHPDEFWRARSSTFGHPDTRRTTMTQMIYVNLPVKDLPTAREFYTRLGYSINAQFSSDDAACVVISDTITVMLLTEPFPSTAVDGHAFCWGRGSSPGRGRARRNATAHSDRVAACPP